MPFDVKAAPTGLVRKFVHAPRRVALRWWLFYIHLISGIAFGLYFVLIGLTGSIIVFVPELSHATMPPAIDRPKDAPPLPLRTIIERVNAAYPDRRITRIRWFPEPEDRYRVTLRADNGDDIDRYLFVDRATGAMLGMEPRWIRWIMELHFYLLSGDTGEKVNGIGALLLGLVSLTGLVVWWPGIRNWARGFKINLRTNWRGLNYDAHRVIGVVSLVMLLVLSISGFYFGFPDPFRRAVNWHENPKSVVRHGLPPVDLEALVVRADAALPGGIVTSLYPPSSPTDTYRFRVKLPGDNWEFGRSEVYFDRYSGDVLGTHNVLTLSLPELMLVHWMVPVHYGRFGGMTTRILWFLVGITPLVLFVSGCLMWWNRSLVKSWRRRFAAPVGRRVPPQLDPVRGDAYRAEKPA